MGRYGRRIVDRDDHDRGRRTIGCGARSLVRRSADRTALRPGAARPEPLAGGRAAGGVSRGGARGQAMRRPADQARRAPPGHGFEPRVGPVSCPRIRTAPPERKRGREGRPARASPRSTTGRDRARTPSGVIASSRGGGRALISVRDRRDEAKRDPRPSDMERPVNPFRYLRVTSKSGHVMSVAIERLLRRLITLIYAGRDRMVVIRRELPRTKRAGPARRPAA